MERNKILRSKQLHLCFNFSETKPSYFSMACPYNNSRSGFPLLNDWTWWVPKKRGQLGQANFSLFCPPHREGQVPVSPPGTSPVPLALSKAQPGKKIRTKPSTRSLYRNGRTRRSRTFLVLSLIQSPSSQHEHSWNKKATAPCTAQPGQQKYLLCHGEALMWCQQQQGLYKRVTVCKWPRAWQSPFMSSSAVSLRTSREIT